MEDLLTPISQVPGVTGTALFAEGGHCLAKKVKNIGQERAFARLLADFDALRDLCAAALDSRNVESVAFEFESATVVLRKVERLFLLVIAEASSNLALMNVVANASVLAITRHQSTADFQNAMSALAQAQAKAMARAADAASSAKQVTEEQFPVRKFSREGLKIPRDALDSRVIERLVEVFGQHAGPRARSWLYDDIHGLGRTPWTLTSENFADLVRAASRRLPREARERFTRDAYGD